MLCHSSCASSYPASTAKSRRHSLKACTRHNRQLPRSCSPLTASGLLTLPTAKFLYPKLLRLISERRRYTLFKELCTNCYITPTPEDFFFFLVSQGSVSYHLVSMSFDAVVPHSTQIQGSIRLPLLIFGYANIMTFEPSATYSQALVDQLKSTLQKTSLATFWAPNYEALMWLVFIGAHISRGQKERPWFIVHLNQGARILGLQELGQLKEILVRFFYLENIYGKRLCEAWNEMQLTGLAV